MQPDISWQESLREWVGFIGGLIGTATALVLLGRPIWSSFWPIRIVTLGKAQATAHPTLRNAAINEVFISVRVETLKRTTGPITKLYAYVDQAGEMNLIEDYHQPLMVIDEQTLTFGYLTNGNYQGKKLVIVAECRMRKGKFAIKKRIPIEQIPG